MNEPPLHAKHILLTKTEQRASILTKLIKEKGGFTVLFPFFKLVAIDDKFSLINTIEHLDKYDFVVFVSPGAVEFALPEIFSHRIWPVDTKAVTVGSETANLLKKNGIEQIIMPLNDFCSEGLLAHPAFQPEFVRGKRVLIMRAESGRELLTDVLRERGALVDWLSCYQRLETPDEDLVVLLQSAPLDALTIFSTEALYKLERIAETGVLTIKGKKLFDLPLFTPHPRVAEKACHFGWQCVKITGMDDLGIINGLCSFDWSGHE